MMQILPKWRVLVNFRGSRPNLEFWMSEAHFGNVLRKVADLSFSANGLDEPLSISIAVCEMPENLSAVRTEGRAQ